MTNPDLLLYAAHLAFWAAFGATRLLTARKSAGAGPEAASATDPPARAAPHSRLAVAFHGLAFGVMYFGIGAAVVPGRVPQWFAGQSVAGAAVIALGAFMACWAVAYFHSWRFEARVDAGHQLATEGPFRLVRHPIYLGLDLLALGSAVWVPTPIVWAGFALMVAGSELRARIEEKLLENVFGAIYTAYRTRTRRFVPGVY